MPKFPEPPDVDRLREMTPVTVGLPTGTQVVRIVFADGPHPTQWREFRFFGPTASRFDHHLPDSAEQPHEQSRGIMYLSTGPLATPTCLAEVFQHTRVIDRESRLPILAGFALSAPVTLLDLSGPFATAIGASTAIHSGPRPRARRWARQLYDAFPEIEGLLYCSSMYGNQPAIALFERAAHAIPARPLIHRELRDAAIQDVLLQTADKIGYVVA